MYELFLIGGFWFWTIVAIEVFTLFSCVHNRNGRGATISLFLFAVLLQQFGNINILGYIVANPLQIACIAVLYVLCGTAWSVYAWWLYVKGQHDLYEEAKYKWLVSRLGKDATIPTGIPDNLKAEWKSELNQSYNKFHIAPRARDHKNDILRWMGWWWVDLICYVIGDFIIGIFISMYNKIVKKLQSISDKTYASTKTDLE